MVEAAVPLSDFLLGELSRRSPPRSAEGRAALVAAAKPLLSNLQAPVLAALMRRRLAEIAGLPEREMAALLPVAADAPVRAARPATSRSAPSLLRGLIQCLLSEPELARKVKLPRPDGVDPDASTLAALVDFCASTSPPLTTPGVMQHFAGTPHEPVLIAALTAAEMDGLSGEAVETQLLDGVRHYWTVLQKRSGAGSAPPVELPPEEAERARQRQLVRARLDGGV
jgi:DNA primase